MRRNSGFTALEVAVTLAIVAVLAAVTMPSFLKWLKAHRLRGASINLVADLEMAKVRAIREGCFVVVQLAADNYFIFVDNGAGALAANWQPDPGEDQIQQRKLPSGVSVALGEVVNPDKRLRFNSRGLAADLVASEMIPLVNEAGRKEVRVNRLGNVRAQ